MKALMTFIKPFEGPQKSVKYFNTAFWNAQGEKGRGNASSNQCPNVQNPQKYYFFGLSLYTYTAAIMLQLLTLNK